MKTRILFIWIVILFGLLKDSSQYECGSPARQPGVTVCDCYPASGLIWCANKKLTSIPIFPKHSNFWYIDLSNNLITEIDSHSLKNFTVVILYNNPLNCTVINDCRIKSHCECEPHIFTKENSNVKSLYSTLKENVNTISSTTTLANHLDISKTEKLTYSSVEKRFSSAIRKNVTKPSGNLMVTTSSFLNDLTMENISFSSRKNWLTNGADKRGSVDASTLSSIWTKLINGEKESLNLSLSIKNITSVYMVAEIENFEYTLSLYGNISQNGFCHDITLISGHFNCLHLILVSSFLGLIIFCIILLGYIYYKRTKIRLEKEDIMNHKW
jgi:hypothetical protein